MNLDMKKTYKLLEKVTKKVLKLVIKTDKNLNKILSIIDKSKELGSDREEFRDAFKEEFLAILSKRVAGKPLVDVV